MTKRQRIEQKKANQLRKERIMRKARKLRNKEDRAYYALMSVGQNSKYAGRVGS